MRVTYLLAASLTALSVPDAHADNDPFFDLQAPLAREEWPNCVLYLDDVVARPDAHVTPDTKVTALEKAIDSLAAGSTPTITELRAACFAQAKVLPDTARHWKDPLEAYVGRMRSGTKEMKEAPSIHSYKTLASEAAACHRWIDLMISVKGADHEVTIPDLGGFPDWKGTAAAAKTELCELAAKAANEAKMKRYEPYLKAGIKNDKLKILTDYDLNVEIGIPGGTFTLGAAALAKANPWFSEASGGSCAGGEITRLHRYEFDKNQKKVKETTKDYCGSVPKSAYR
jgi:hypothetical protein